MYRVGPRIGRKEGRTDGHGWIHLNLFSIDVSGRHPETPEPLVVGKRHTQTSALFIYTCYILKKGERKKLSNRSTV